jgi:hypothetical protein
MMKARKERSAGELGVALLTTLLLLLLMLSLAIALTLVIVSGMELSGLSRNQSRAFYGAEAGMERMTADLGTLFDANYAPSPAELSKITTTPPSISGIDFKAADGSSGYKLDYPTDNLGNPKASAQTIKSGPYQGMVGLVTPYTLTTTARTENGAEVALRRTVQTVGIPAFEFGIFSESDLSFFARPSFGFGGRVHTNGDLYLAQFTGAILTLSDKVTAFGEVIRTNLANGEPLSSNGIDGTVRISTGPGHPFRVLGPTEGSATWSAAKPFPTNSTWPTISQTDYNSNLANHRTGVLQKLQLPLQIRQNNPVSPIELIRRPTQGEAGDPELLGQRYFAQASMKILLSDQARDIMLLPCIDATTQPVDLSTLAVDRTSPFGYYGFTGYDPTTILPTWYVAGNSRPIPIATSAGGRGTPAKTVSDVSASSPQPNGYNSVDGYWIPRFDPMITGFLKIEIQIAYDNPCGRWQDVTQEILKLGIAGRNQNPSSVAFPNAPTLPSVQVPPSSCADPSPNAIIRLEHLRDNPNPQPNSVPPSTVNVNACGFDLKAGPLAASTDTKDYWPNALFDPREGSLRDNCPSTGATTGVCWDPALMAGGVMSYVELDMNNLARWLTGRIGVSGPGTFDPQNASNNYVVYFSDRRGNYAPTGSVTGAWPSLSPSGNETGEYGFSDFINPGNPANGCPDGSLNGPGEDVAEANTFYTYGQALPAPNVTFEMPHRLFSDALFTVITQHPMCTRINPWPGSSITFAQEARMNPVLFFRRALKLVNGSNLQGPLSATPCPGGVVCGITVASENAVYVQGDFNANSGGNGFNDPHVAAAIIADAVTLLSNDWNDVNSFTRPYDKRNRTVGRSAWYRMAVLAGKGRSFPYPGGTITFNTGTDGGVHNFLRYLEDWSNRTANYRGSLVSLFYNRQATGIYKIDANTVYEPPTRNYAFDTDFLQPSLLPPRTPMFRDVNTTSFSQLLYPEQQ